MDIEEVFVNIIANAYPAPISPELAAAITFVLNRYNFILDNICIPGRYKTDNEPFEFTERFACDVVATVLSGEVPFSVGSGAWYGGYHGLYNHLHDSHSFNELVAEVLEQLQMQPCIKSIVDGWA